MTNAQGEARAAVAPTDEDPRLAELTEKELLFEIWSEVRAFRRFIVWGVATLLVVWMLAGLAVVAQAA